MRIIHISYRMPLLLAVCAMLAAALYAYIFPAAPKNAEALKIWLGGDIEVERSTFPVPVAIDGLFAFDNIPTSNTVEMATFAEFEGRKTPIKLKSIDDRYPLYGNLTFSQQTHPRVFFQNRVSKTYGVAVTQTLLDILSLKLDDTFTIGDVNLVIRAVVGNEPDPRLHDLLLGPRVFINDRGFREIQRLQKDRPVIYRLRIRLDSDRDIPKAVEKIVAAAPQAKSATISWRTLATDATTPPHMRPEAPATVPDMIFTNVHGAEMPALVTQLQANPQIKQVEYTSLMQGALVYINGKNIQERKLDDEGLWLLRNRKIFASVAPAPTQIHVTAGHWWDPNYRGESLLAMDYRMAKKLGLSPGDDLTMTLPSKTIRVKMAALYDGKGDFIANHVGGFLSPGAFDGLREMYIVTAQVPAEAQTALIRDVAKTFPDVAIARGRELLNGQ